MTDGVNGIFICYRQDDAKAWALMLRDELVRTFGEDSVFLDVDDLQGGSRRVQVEAALARSKVALVVIGPLWLGAGGHDGQSPADDAHRREVALALSTPGVTVIPVRVEGAAMPRAEQLGADTRALTEQHTRTISDAGTQRALDLERLVGDIERATGRAAPQSATAQGPAPAGATLRSKTRLLTVAAVLSVVFLVTAQLTWTTPPDAVESSFLVLIALLLTMAGAWVKNRLGGKGR